MKLRPIASTAAVARVGRKLTEYRVTKLTNRLACTFVVWQKAYIHRLIELQAEERYALGVLLSMTVCEREDLTGIGTSGMVYEAPDGPTLEWMRPDGRRGARLLSSLIALSVGDDLHPRCGGRFMVVLEAALRKLDPGLQTSDDPIEAALACSEAWCFQELTNFFSHLCGDLPMTPLPRSAYARLESQHALACEFETGLGEADDAATAIAGFLQSRGIDEGSKTLQEIIDLTKLRDVEGKSDAQLREDLASIWRGQIDASELAGPLTCLQLGCALQLAYAAKHKPATIAAYVRHGFPVVHDALAKQELVSMSAEQLSERLAESLEKVDGQNRRNARAYLGHLWRFAREWIDVEPLMPSLLPHVDVAAVDANVVWQHEGQRMDEWLDGTQHDPDLARQTLLVRRLMAALKVRLAEVVFLQIRNVIVYTGQDYVDIEIVTRGRLHGLKSKDAQRIARVKGPLAAEVLGQVNRRLVEQKAFTGHLLFGTKAEPDRVYRLSAMYSWLNRAVKVATGDSTSCCHHFRHTTIDDAFAGMSLAEIMAGALEQLRVDAGHLDLRSTQRSYLHRFTRALREATEASIAELVRLSDTLAAEWIGLSAANLRKIRSRSLARSVDSSTKAAPAELSSTSDWYWSMLQAAARQKSFPSATIGYFLFCPLPPKPLGAARPWSVVDLIAFLGDLENGDTPSQACRQRRLPQEVGPVVTRALLELAEERMRTGRAPVDVVLTSPAAAIAALKLRTVTAYQAKYDTWRRALAAELPGDFPDANWDSWLRSGRGQYVKLSLVQRPERWLTHVLASGLPASKLLVCIDEADSSLALDIRRMVRTASALALVTGGSVRYEPCTYNDRRGHCYLLVADEAEVLTHQTGAAFTPAGLKVIVLAMWLASLAKRAQKVSSS